MSLTVTPTILLSELYFPYLQQEGEFARIVEKVAEENFYRAIELGSIHSQSERARIKSIVETADLVLTQWLTDRITDEELDLSSSNQQIRKEAVKRIVDLLHLPLEVGAKNVALISGLNHGEEVEKESLKGFYESLCEISEEAAKHQLTVLVEPLDKHAHKKRFIGSSQSLFEIIKKVKQYHSNIGYAFDTAHAELNEESIEDSLELVHPYLEQIHFANAVLDPNHELYGDYHIRIGSPGFMTETRIGEVTSKLKELYAESDKNLRVSIEMRSIEVKDIPGNLSLANRIMKQILNNVSCNNNKQYI